MLCQPGCFTWCEPSMKCASLGRDAGAITAVLQESTSTSLCTQQPLNSWSECIQAAVIHCRIQVNFAEELRVDNLNVALEQVPFSLWLETEFSRPCNQKRICWNDFWEVLIEQLINRSVCSCAQGSPPPPLPPACGSSSAWQRRLINQLAAP